MEALYAANRKSPVLISSYTPWPEAMESEKDTIDSRVDKSLCNRVKDVRFNARLNKSEFADKLGLKSRSLISDIERYRIEPSKRVLSKIQEVFRVNPTWLYTGKGSI
jgi:ribosome-binding protein aMBF1 (putative translation factor)